MGRKTIRRFLEKAHTWELVSELGRREGVVKMEQILPDGHYTIKTSVEGTVSDSGPCIILRVVD